jgi:glucose-1-phosphate cytidylyltransferase
LFLANYADGLCDLPLNDYIDRFVKRNKIASFVCVKPTTYFHIVSHDENGTVTRVEELPRSAIRMNGGSSSFSKRSLTTRGRESSL